MVIMMIRARSIFPCAIYRFAVESGSGRSWRPLFSVPARGRMARIRSLVISPLLVEISGHVSFPNWLLWRLLLRGGRIGKIHCVFPVGHSALALYFNALIFSPGSVWEVNALM